MVTAAYNLPLIKTNFGREFVIIALQNGLPRCVSYLLMDAISASIQHGCTKHSHIR